jgi:hypothetical protein
VGAAPAIEFPDRYMEDIVDTAVEHTPDFSLVLGGPLYQLFRRTHLSGPVLELLKRRIIFITAIAWTPLAILAIADHHFAGNTGLTFVHDIETHVRFLVALPILIAAELLVHERMRPMIRNFVDRGIIRPTQLQKFYMAVDSALRMRNSVTLEIVLILCVYTVAHWLWRDQVASGTSNWYVSRESAQVHYTLAGYWDAFISVPIFQFLLLRWYLRLFIWFWFLCRVSRLDLDLMPAHPDRVGGLGFLGRVSYAFSPLLFAQGAVFAGILANRIFYQDQSLLVFKYTILGYLTFLVLVVLIPLLIVTPNLMAAKREGLGQYGSFATKYVRRFDEKWIRGGATDELLGTADIQSLADLGNSVSVVREMKIVPFSTDDVIRLALAGGIPCLPLLLTIMPFETLLVHLVKIVF